MGTGILSLPLLPPIPGPALCLEESWRHTLPHTVFILPPRASLYHAPTPLSCREPQSMSRLLLSACFLTTATKLSQLPPALHPELAFVGRSNVGKSSAINALCQRQRHKLAFSSKTPGRTQALNYFSLSESQNTAAYLVDTPGYGFAKTTHTTINSWAALAGEYLKNRKTLAAIVLILDIRRKITPLDWHLLSIIRPQTPLLLLLSKTDRISKDLCRRTIDALTEELERSGLQNPMTLLSFSATHHIGVQEGRELIEQHVFAACRK